MGPSCSRAKVQDHLILSSRFSRLAEAVFNGRSQVRERQSQEEKEKQISTGELRVLEPKTSC